MSKVTLTDVAAGPTTAMALNINSNNQSIEAAFDNTLSRDGTSPNTMESSLDMNSNRILNLPEPLSVNEPVRLADLAGVLEGTDTVLVPSVSPSDANKIVKVDAAGSGYQYSGVQIDSSNNVVPITDNGSALGTTTLKWSDIFLADGAVINFNNGDITITHSTDTLDFLGASTGYHFDNKVLVGSTTSYPGLGGLVTNVQSHSSSVSPFAGFRWDNTTTGAFLSLLKSRSGAVGTHAIVQNGDTLGGILFGGSNGASFDSGASIHALVDNTPGVSADMPGALSFRTSSDGSATPTERMKINSTGSILFPSGVVINFNSSDVTWTHSSGIVTSNKDFRVTAAGTNTASVVTVGGTQTLTNKSFIAPILGTPASGDLGNCTDLPVGSISGLGTGVATFLATPSSFNLSAAVTDETGSGALLFSTSPTIFTPNIVGTAVVGNALSTTLGEVITASATAQSLTTATTANVTSISLTAGDWDVYGNVVFTPAATTSLTRVQAGTTLTTATLPAGTGAAPYIGMPFTAFVPTAIALGYTIAPLRVNVAATTSVFLVAQATFTVSTMSAGGTLYARRVR